MSFSAQPVRIVRAVVEVRRQTSPIRFSKPAPARIRRDLRRVNPAVKGAASALRSVFIVVVSSSQYRLWLPSGFGGVLFAQLLANEGSGLRCIVGFIDRLY